jgi:hypothetical protein
MLLFETTLIFRIISKSTYLGFISVVIVFSIYSFFKRKTKDRDSFQKNKDEEEERVEKVEVTREGQNKVEFKTIVIEQPELNHELVKVNIDQQKKESLLISSKIKKQIEKIILKILYEEKAVKTLKLLSDKVLENAAKQKITVSEKVINLLINQMNKIEKIEFTQKEGWRIKI